MPEAYSHDGPQGKDQDAGGEAQAEACAMLFGALTWTTIILEDLMAGKDVPDDDIHRVIRKANGVLEQAVRTSKALEER